MKKKYKKEDVDNAIAKIETGTERTLERTIKGIKKLAKQKAVSRKVLKKKVMVVNVPDYKAPSILGDENRFFRGEFNKEKRGLFFL